MWRYKIWGRACSNLLLLWLMGYCLPQVAPSSVAWATPQPSGRWRTLQGSVRRRLRGANGRGCPAPERAARFPRVRSFVCPAAGGHVGYARSLRGGAALRAIPLPPRPERGPWWRGSAAGGGAADGGREAPRRARAGGAQRRPFSPSSSRPSLCPQTPGPLRECSKMSTR